MITTAEHYSRVQRLLLDVFDTPVDIGESKLLTGCACQNDIPAQPYIYDGGRARALRKEMFTTLKRLQERDAAEWRVDE